MSSPAKHRCHWPDCDRAVPPRMWGCKEHWLSLPLSLRREIWRAYVPGQEISKTPSAAYVAAARAVRAWIKRTHGEQRRLFAGPSSP